VINLNSFFKKFILALMTSVLTTTTTVYAVPSVESVQINIEELDSNIEAVMRKIDDNNKQILSTENDIKTTETDLTNITNDLNKEKDLFNNRLRVMYMNGFGGYLNVLLDSKNVDELISNSDEIIRLINLNVGIIDGYKNTQDLISKKRESLIAQNNELLSLKADNEKELAQLNTAKEEQSKLLVESDNLQKLYSSDDDKLLIADAVNYIENIKKNPSIETFSNGKTSLSTDNIMAYASDFLGTPYVWGGTSPTPGFDCSGFTQYVYNHFNIHIGRTTYDQIKDGVEVSRDQLKPGDLIFFGTKEDPHHVGIYIGFGAYIQAPHTGDVIKISPLNRSDYLTARRVM
jgi:cell wall-associated NlpC family hydrolase